MRKGGILLLVWLICLSFTGKAQEIVTEVADTIRQEQQEVRKRISAEDPNVSVVILDDSVRVPAVDMASAFKPNPTRATLYALIPGMGQIYNRKYWKLPLVYGGFMGFFYAITWNNRNYQDYKEAYFDVVVGNTDEKASWRDFVRVPGLSPEEQNAYINNSSFVNELKSKKDYFRRYRDLSIILTVGFYAITIIDAYVDAQLFDFDITPDLSMRVEPVYTPPTSFSSRTYGLNCSFTF